MASNPSIPRYIHRTAGRYKVSGVLRRHTSTSEIIKYEDVFLKMASNYHDVRAAMGADFGSGYIFDRIMIVRMWEECYSFAWSLYTHTRELARGN